MATFLVRGADTWRRCRLCVCKPARSWSGAQTREQKEVELDPVLFHHQTVDMVRRAKPTEAELANIKGFGDCLIAHGEFRNDGCEHRDD